MDAANKGKKCGKKGRKSIMRAAIAKRWRIAKSSEPSTSCPTLSPSKQTKQDENRLSASKRKLSYLDSSPKGQGFSTTGDELPSSNPASLMSPSTTLEPSPSTSKPTRTWCLVEFEQMNQLYGDALCPLCLSDSLLLKKGEQGDNKGFSEQLYIICKNGQCTYKSKTVFSSPKIKDEPTQPYEVNTIMTMYANDIGKGNAALQKLQLFFGLGTMSAPTFRVHQEKVNKATKATTLSLFQKAAEKIKVANIAELCDDNVTNITVSFDGTWQKRGFSSKYGVGVAIEVKTGLVIDFEVLSTYCHSCSLASKKFENDPDGLSEWKKKHSKCSINFNGSPKAMEAEAARRIWSRSVDTFALRYTKILSDGDASTFSALTTLNPYGSAHPVVKMDCVNHADKRFGTALRKAIKENKLGGRGQGRLTECKAKLLQKYYGNAIRGNIGNAEEMRKAIWASYHHSVSTDENPRHQNCPIGPDSWCIYNKAMAKKMDMPKHGPSFCRTFLSSEVAKHLVPIYERMTDVNLLGRMLTGATQNANESCNNLIWVHCPKNIFVSFSTLYNSVEVAISKFNAGATTTSDRMRVLGIEPSSTQMSFMEQEDRKRVHSSERKEEDSKKKCRKMKQEGNRRAIAQLEKSEGLQYGAGEF